MKLTAEQKAIRDLEGRIRVLTLLLNAFESECAGRASDRLANVVGEWRRLRTRIAKAKAAGKL
jgi:hypothetical protein